MILSDRDILNFLKAGKLKISPFRQENLNPSSYDVTLGEEFLIYKDPVYDITKELSTHKIKVRKSLIVCPVYYDNLEELKEKYQADYVIRGGVLATTQEYIELPENIAGQYQGRSSFGRIFLTSHQTAGYIDAGFKGRITLEIVALDKPVVLYPGLRIGQIIFHKLNSPAKIGYSNSKKSKYKQQLTVTPAKREVIRNV